MCSLKAGDGVMGGHWHYELFFVRLCKRLHSVAPFAAEPGLVFESLVRSLHLPFSLDANMPPAK